ncbi:MULTISPECIES: hypothetical protein [Microbacterium]|uniref:hypothetical protein n=1 Tax=Microbacterium TaxID=33882 RepID=UPI00146EFB42|nr:MULTISPECIES: hypothetical protein [Microbacterium]
MTTYETGSPDHTDSGGEGLKDKATDAAAEVGAGAKNVAGVAKNEASHVAREARSAARGLLYDARTQLTDQASTQKQRAADGLRNVGSQFSSMAASTESGAASTLVRTLSKRADSAASWLSDREPADIVQDVRGFARRNTGLFLAIAAGVGVVAGRVVRALREGEPQESTSFSAATGNGTNPALGATATPPGYDETPLATAVASGQGTTVGGDAAGYGAGAVDAGSGERAVDDTTPSDPWAAPGTQGDRP